MTKMQRRTGVASPRLPLSALAEQVVRLELEIERLHVPGATIEAERAAAPFVSAKMERQAALADEILARAGEHPANLMSLARAATAVMEKDAGGDVRASDLAEQLAWRVVALVADPTVVQDLDDRLAELADMAVARFPGDPAAAQRAFADHLWLSPQLARHAFRDVSSIVIQALMVDAFGRAPDPHNGGAAA